MQREGTLPSIPPASSRIVDDVTLLDCGNCVCRLQRSCSLCTVTLMLVNTVSRLVNDALAHVEVTTETSAQLHKRSDYWRLIISHPGHSIVMKRGLPHYFFKLKRLMRNYCAEKNLIVSENFIDDQIVKLLVESKVAAASLPDIASHVKNWIDNIDKIQQHNYVAIFPLTRYHFRGKVDTPHMKIVKITDEEISDNLWPISDALKDKFSPKELTSVNETDTFAIVNTRANDSQSAAELAQSMVDRFVYAVKLIDPNTTASSRKNSYKGLSVTHAIYNKSKDELRGVFERVNDPPNIIQEADFYDKFNEPWVRLLNFLFDNHPTELQKSIIDALYWYGEVDVYRDSLVSQYLYCLIGLEKLLVRNGEQRKAKKFGEHASIVLNGNVDHAGFYEEYYKKRNSLIHEGPIMIYKEDVDSLRSWLRQILLELVNNATKFIDLKSYYNDKHNIKW